jgi:quercetin dioxygenase-like cupin family protein
MKMIWRVGIVGLSGLFVGCAGKAAPQVESPKEAPAAATPCEPTSFGHDPPIDAPSSLNASPTKPQAPDPITTDGDKYRVILENDRVRVLRYQDKPGDKTKPHYHVEFVLYALSPFRRRLIFPDGTVKERDFSPGDVIWMPAQVHTGENIGQTDTDVIIVENKQP